MPEASRASRRQPDPQPLPPPTALKGREERPEEDRPTSEVLRPPLAVDQPVSQAEASSALEWFLSEEPEEDEEQTHTIELNVGVGDKEHWITWIVRPIDSDELPPDPAPDREPAPPWPSGRPGHRPAREPPAVIIAGSSPSPTFEPSPTRRPSSPRRSCCSASSRSLGLIAQLAGQIMSLSGFDDEDVRDAISAKNL